MSNRLLKTVALLAFTAWSTFALAQDLPSRVGRVAVAQGQVSISDDAGQSAAAVSVNWPVTAHDLVTTAPGARTELRIGSTSVRIDGDSSLEVSELDDNNLRLRLHYGSASIRIVNPEVLAGFELTTPQGRVRMQEPGRLRVDAERVRDTSSVTVFEGVALVEGGGANLSVRAGRRAELHDEDVSTAQAARDGFDEWALGRDKLEASATSSRYVTSEMTGSEDLDRYGSWQTDNQYGALWMPSVGPGWVPYRDGTWAWVEPWGWTWVDNAPWGYAPFHYGQWVYMNKHKRWAWAPGRREHRPTWGPAQVWQTVPGAKRPPLAPPDGRHGDWRRGDRRGDQRGPDHDRRGERDGFNRGGRDHGQRPTVAMPPPVLSTQPQPRQPITALTAPPVLPGQPARPPQPVMPNLPQPHQPITVLTPPPVLPGQQVQPVPQPHWRDDRREQFEDGRRGNRPGRWSNTGGRPEAMVAPQPAPMPQPVAAPPQAVAPPPQPARPPMPMPQPSPAPAPIARPMPAPAPPPAAAPAPAQARAAPARGADDNNVRHQER